MVYVQDGDKFLLIALLQEPTAHAIAIAIAIATMQTPDDVRRMKLFVKIAEDFIHTGTIIA